jgi:hypothetical protein
MKLPNLKSLFRKAPPKPEWLRREPARYMLAFTLKGRRYWRMRAHDGMAALRAFEAQSVYVKMGMGATQEDIVAHLDALRRLSLNSTKLDKLKEDVLVASDDLRARLKWGHNTDLLYELASVVAFDESESPFTYDADYAAEKIAFWKANMNKELAAFFLNQPIREFLPSGVVSASALMVFLEGQQRERQNLNKLLLELGR